jgi:hypothetical protein
LRNKFRKEELYKEAGDSRVISFIAIARETPENPDRNVIRKYVSLLFFLQILINRDVFQELIDFDKVIYEVYLEDDFEFGVKETNLTGRKITLNDICQQFNYTIDEDDEDAVILPPKCLST